MRFGVDAKNVKTGEIHAPLSRGAFDGKRGGRKLAFAHSALDASDLPSDGQHAFPEIRRDLIDCEPLIKLLHQSPLGLCRLSCGHHFLGCRLRY
jgi:hypothetical protein